MYITGPAHRSGGSRRVNCWPQIESRSRSLARNTEHFAHRARLGIAYASSAIEDRAPRARALVFRPRDNARERSSFSVVQKPPILWYTEPKLRHDGISCGGMRNVVAISLPLSLSLSFSLSLSLSFSLSCILEPSRRKTRFPPFLDLVSTRCWKIRSLRERKKKRDPNPNA